MSEADVQCSTVRHREKTNLGWLQTGRFQAAMRTLWRHLCKTYDGPTMALHRIEPLPAWLVRRLPANDR
ncbi:hypothetical protein [Pacificimonas flava]|uniref:Uncharacterized protein n=1 Tax=Pacificimonas flava TaxID=1234595 RepID=M2SD93_9SPHN|nr:hypothetical protein [Pacificimonas flava]EMD83320.1 hypothetical protein C725_1221 [Pacificimonas flava]MBB5279121.1 hypothetical protein [Pacificimonas flava]